jgi:HPt (histidine-containing phosphotransfer) domain-containing protein
VDTLASLLAIFRDDCKRLLEDIEQALPRRDGALLRTAAHTLKGMVAFFEAKAAVTTALQLETLGAQGQFAEAPALLANLSAEIDTIQRVFGAMCPTGGA